MQNNLKIRFDEVKQEILTAQNLSQFKQQVELIAVSKTFSSSDIKELYNLGQRNFAENYAIEFFNKAQELHDLDIRWHYIGGLQTNKIKYIAPYALWVHSVEKSSQILALNSWRPHNLPKLNILLQIKINNSDSQNGINSLELTNILELVQLINQQKNLIFRGVMGIASNTIDKNLIATQFNTLQKLLSVIKSYNINNADTLSMGMSNDFETAIGCGATHVRIGSKIFGSRNYTK